MTHNTILSEDVYNSNIKEALNQPERITISDGHAIHANVLTDKDARTITFRFDTSERRFHRGEIEAIADFIQKEGGWHQRIERKMAGFPAAYEVGDISTSKEKDSKEFTVTVAPEANYDMVYNNMLLAVESAFRLEIYSGGNDYFKHAVMQPATSYPWTQEQLEETEQWEPVDQRDYLSEEPADSAPNTSGNAHAETGKDGERPSASVDAGNILRAMQTGRRIRR